MTNTALSEAVTAAASKTDCYGILVKQLDVTEQLTLARRLTSPTKAVIPEAGAAAEASKDDGYGILVKHSH